MTQDEVDNDKPKSPGAELRERIIKRAALEFKDGMYGILDEVLSGKLIKTICSAVFYYTLICSFSRGEGEGELPLLGFP